MTADTPCAARLPSGFLYECGTLPGNASTSPAARSKRSPATKIVTSPARHVKNSRVPGRCGEPRIEAPGANSMTLSSSSGTRSGISERTVTPRPRSDSRARHAPTCAPSRAVTPAARRAARPARSATLTSTVSEGLPLLDSRLEIVERGTPAAFASAPWVRLRTCRSATRLRARWAATSSGRSIVECVGSNVRAATFRHCGGHGGWFAGDRL